MRRFTRLTNGFSKKIENMKAAVSLHFAHYNFVRQHKTLRMTPAMAAGVEKGMWDVQEFVERTSKCSVCLLAFCLGECLPLFRGSLGHEDRIASGCGHHHQRRRRWRRPQARFQQFS